MVHVVRLAADRPIPEGALATLCSASATYVESDAAPVVELLRQAGLTPLTIPTGGVPDGAAIALTPSPLERLADIADILLGPNGCPWDRGQTHESLKQHLLEETYETLDAIDSGSSAALREELGDLILQPIMHAAMKKVAGEYGIEEVADGISDKLVRRHPHVFGDASVDDADDVLRNWDRIKQREKSAGGDESDFKSILGGIPRSLPSLLRAHEVGKRAARTGFEWRDLSGVFDKLREEENELRQACETGSASEIQAEVGDLLFSVAQIARWLKVEPEDALRLMIDRFSARFEAMERSAKKPLIELSFDEWDELWERSKIDAGVTS